MNNVKDLNARVCDTVKDQIFPDGKTTTAFFQFVTSTANIGVISQQREQSNQTIDERIRREFVIRSNETPDIEDISFCPSRQTVGHVGR
jgi:hypothetical protein